MMPSQNGGSANGRALSLPGLLAAAVGGGMLLVYWKFDALFADQTQAARLGFLAGAVTAISWGLKQCLSGGRPARRSRIGLGRYRVLLPRQGLIYLVIMAVMFVGSLLGRSNMLMLVFALMAGPFVLNGWITFSMLQRTRVTRRVPPRAMAGEPVSVEVTLENNKFVLSSWLMSVEDQISNGAERLESGVLFARVPPRDRRHAHYQIRLMQRGRYAFGPTQMTTRFPLGLVERGLLFNAPDEILVHPRLGRLSSAWKRKHLLASELVHRSELRRGAFDDEFHNIREYRWGDNPRAIHWRTSARKNEIMMREFHQSRDQNLIVLLDLWTPRWPVDEDHERVELAVSFAATVCVTQMRQSRDANMCLAAAGSRFTLWEGLSGPASIEDLMDTLALLQPGASNGIPRLVEQARIWSAPNIRIVLITTRREVDAVQAEFAGASETTSPVQIVEADGRALASVFEIA
jgi:uncharacterized protein (DUF58 family)